MNYQSNIKRVYVFCFFWMFLVIIPVFVPFLIDMGLSMRKVFELQAIFGATIAICEVPSGYIADLIGRKKTLVLGSLLSALGFTALNYITTYEGLVVYEVILAVGASLVSGSDFSILYDSLDKINASRDDKTKAVANIQMSYVSAESIASVLGGVLAVYSFSLVIKVHALTSWIAFFIALTIFEPESEKLDSKSHLENVKEILRHLFLNDKLVRLIFINLTVWSIGTFIAVWMYQKYWMNNGIDLKYFGYIWAGYNLLVGVVGKKVHDLERRFGPVSILISLSLFIVVGYLGMSYSVGVLGIVFGLCFQFSRGMTQVILKDALNWRTPNQYRATVNSISSLFMRGAFFVVGPLIGILIDSKGMNFALMTLGFSFLALFIVVMIPLIFEVRKLKVDEIPH